MTDPAWLSKKILRRAFLKSLGAATLTAFAALQGCAWSNPFMAPPVGLRVYADRARRLYGAAVQSDQLNEASFANALQREANLIVPETELKWDVVHPLPDHYDFSGYQRLADFATRHGMGVRGHCLVWHEANPAWLEPALVNRPTAERILRDHIEHVIHNTATVIHNWDVVNEAIDARSERSDGLRDTLWLRALGPDYVPLAFQIARQARPGLTFVYNDFGLEYDDGVARAKRRATLQLLEKCRRNGTPIDSLGLQSHLQCHKPLGGKDFTDFLCEVRALGLSIVITELDLDLRLLTGTGEEKSLAAQNFARSYLDSVFTAGPVAMLLTWGLSDRYSWLKDDTRPIEGALPLDADLQHAPLWDTLKSDWLKV